MNKEKETVGIIERKSKDVQIVEKRMRDWTPIKGYKDTLQETEEKV